LALGYFIHVSITTPIASALKIILTDMELSRSSNGHFNHFWIQVAVSEVKRQLGNRFESETVTNL
jgi:hypothetical protein